MSFAADSIRCPPFSYEFGWQPLGAARCRSPFSFSFGFGIWLSGRHRSPVGKPAFFLQFGALFLSFLLLDSVDLFLALFCSPVGPLLDLAGCMCISSYRFAFSLGIAFLSFSFAFRVFAADWLSSCGSVVPIFARFAPSA